MILTNISTHREAQSRHHSLVQRKDTTIQTQEPSTTSHLKAQAHSYKAQTAPNPTLHNSLALDRYYHRPTTKLKHEIDIITAPCSPTKDARQITHSSGII